MKKILSTLVMCLILGVGNVWAQNVTSTLTVNVGSNLNPAQVSSLIDVDVCDDLGINCSEEVKTFTVDATVATPTKHNDALGLDDRSNNFKNATLELTILCYVSTELLDINNDYLFSHWTIEGDGVSFVTQPTSTSGICTFKITKTNSFLFDITSERVSSGWLKDRVYTVTPKEGVSSAITLVAHWVQPDVTGVADGTANGTRQSTYSLGTITNPTQIDKNIVFNLSNDNAGLQDIDGNVPANYYYISTSLNSNGYTNGAMSHTKGSGTLTIPITYTPTGVHNQTNSASLVVKSNYPSSGANSWTVVLNVTEDYKPSFTLDASSYNFTPTQPISNAASSEAYTLPISGRNYAASNIAEWGVSWSAVTYDGGAAYFNTNPYSVDITDINNPKVIFTAPATGTYKDVTATLTITAKYKDANGNLIASDQKTITFSADAGEQLTINDEREYTMEFGVVDFGKEDTDEVELISTSSDLDEFVNNPVAGITFNVDVANEKVIVSIASTTAIGNHAPSLTLSKGALSVVLNVKAQVKLAKPIVTPTTGLGQSIDLSWSAVKGATSYIVKSGETVVATIEDPAITTFLVDNIGGKPLVMGTEYPFTVTAVYEPNAFGNRTSDEIKAKATAPTDIDSLTEINIYTGTEKAGAYPYHKDGKRLVDLSAAFKDGKAIFDQLFIFGLTIGDANDVIYVPEKTANSNAVTPCYIYNKSGDNYVLDQTIENVNVADKPDAFIITAAGQKIYFTGYAPYASCGYTWEENGVFYIKGSDNIDIYLNDFELYARHKTDVGNYPKTKTFEVNQDNVTSYLGMDEFELDMTIIPFKFKGINVYSQGSGAAFCFYPNTNNFSANIHLSGDNVLQSARGMDVHVNVSVGLTMDDTADQHSAPIQIIHDKNSKSRSTTLTIDDKWVSGDRTNGVLDLAKIDYRHAPTIDLGNEKTTLIFDGGQIYLSNSFNTSSTYSVSYAISYRCYSIKDGMAKMYGLGSDQPGGKVLFKDGTIECKPLKDAVINANETAKAIFKNLFHNASSMKCPANTKIDGGTFNCDVLACNSSTSKGGSPTNSDGSPLCMVDIPVKTQLANGLVETLIDDWMNYAAQLPDGANTNDLSYYGIESMNPEQITDVNGDPSTVVHMMLPSNNICFKEEIIKHWVMCYPQLSITTNQGLEAGGELGGDKEVLFSIQTDDDTKLVTIEKTSKFLFASMDDITIDAVETYSAPGNSTDIVLLDGGYPANIINEEEYVIYDKVYILMPLVANEWKLFSPPFDISNVYVIESYPENKLIEKFSNGATDKKGNPIITGDKIAEARKAQSHRMLDMLYHWIWENDATGGNSDVWSNHKSYPAMGHFYSVGTFMQYWYDMYDASERPVIEQLYHYKSNNEGYPKGMSRWDANFYLYEVDGESWVIDENGLQTSWKEVPTISIPRDIKGTNKVIMEKGHVYSMSFPYTIVNSEVHDPSTVWDYWTGKYILLEGYPAAENNIDSDGDGILDSRGQKIAGSNAMDDIMEEYTEDGKAVVRGNYTFSSNEVSSDNVFVINGNNENEYQDEYDHNVFVNYETAWLYPAECFVYANAPASPFGMPRSVASINPQSGEITYRDNTTTSTPTISGNNQMLVYNIESGVGIVPIVAQQVSIFNAAGQMVTSQYLTDEVHISLPTGIYLIAGARDQFKAVVK